MSQNNEAWQRFFEKTDTLARIEQEGLCRVSARDLKQIGRREPRLMAKLDTLAIFASSTTHSSNGRAGRENR